MPDLVLKCGQTVIIDDEDYDFVQEVTWYVRDRPDRSRRIIHDEWAGGRMFRIFLHRAIAIRVRPDLIPYVANLKVKARNGDYTDVRRSNLEITLSKRDGGDPRRKPEGYAHKKIPKRIKGTISADHVPADKSPLWGGGVAKLRTYKTPDKSGRRWVRTYAGRVIVGADGPSGGGLLGDHAGQDHDREREGGTEAAVHLRGEDESG